MCSNYRSKFLTCEKLLLILFLIPLLCEFYPVLGIDSVQEITDFFFLVFHLFWECSHFTSTFSNGCIQR